MEEGCRQLVPDELEVKGKIGIVLYIQPGVVQVNNTVTNSSLPFLCSSLAVVVKLSFENLLL